MYHDRRVEKFGLVLPAVSHRSTNSMANAPTGHLKKSFALKVLVYSEFTLYTTTKVVLEIHFRPPQLLVSNSYLIIFSFIANEPDMHGWVRSDPTPGRVSSNIKFCHSRVSWHRVKALWAYKKTVMQPNDWRECIRLFHSKQQLILFYLHGSHSNAWCTITCFHIPYNFGAHSPDLHHSVCRFPNLLVQW